MPELQFRDTAVTAYDVSFAQLTTRPIPPLLLAARVVPGQRVLDIASGTGLAAQAAAAAVGASGHVVSADISPAMSEKARERLDGLPNTSVAVEDGQSLAFPAESFDAVLCNMGLMYFPEPARGLLEFHRVLRPGGRAAASVTVSAERSLFFRILVVIARHVPDVNERSPHASFDGGEQHMHDLFERAGFSEVECSTEILHFSFPSFDAYFGDIERGAGNVGQEYTAMPETLRRVVREETRRYVGDTGGPLSIEVAINVVGGRR